VAHRDDPTRKADVARGEAELVQQRANIAQVRAQLEGARSSEASAVEQVKRYEPLVLTGAETEERPAELRNARSQAAATVAIDSAAAGVTAKLVGSPIKLSATPSAITRRRRCSASTTKGFSVAADRRSFELRRTRPGGFLDKQVTRGALQRTRANGPLMRAQPEEPAKPVAEPRTGALRRSRRASSQAAPAPAARARARPTR
jgi:hypothetical protein